MLETENHRRANGETRVLDVSVVQVVRKYNGAIPEGKLSGVGLTPTNSCQNLHM